MLLGRRKSDGDESRCGGWRKMVVDGGGVAEGRWWSMGVGWLNSGGG